MKNKEPIGSMKVEKMIRRCILRSLYNKNLINQPTYEKIIYHKGKRKKKEV